MNTWTHFDTLSNLALSRRGGGGGDIDCTEVCRQIDDFYCFQFNTRSQVETFWYDWPIAKCISG